MAVNITLSCDVCHIETGPHRLPHREFHSFGVWKHPTIDDVPFPDGWLYSDPYSGCTYCPECWAEIIGDAMESAS